MLDRVVLVVAQAAEHDEPRLLRGLGQQQLGDDLFGAGEVEQLDVGEVQQGGEAVGTGEGDLDAVPDRGAGGPGDEMAIGRGRRLTQQVTDPDGLDHLLSTSCVAGMVICTWAPGKYGR